MKIKKLYEVFEGLNALSQKELPIKVAFLVQKNMSEVQGEIETSEKVRQKLIEKYKDEEKTKAADPGMVHLQLDKLDDYNKGYNELMDQEVEIKLQKIKISDLDGITVKPIVLRQLDSIITE